MRRWMLDLSLRIVGIFRDFASRMRIASFVGPTLQVHPSLPKAHFSFRPKVYLYLEYRLCLSGSWLWLFLKRILFVTHNIRGGYCIDVKMAFAYDECIEVGSYELASYTSQRLPQSIVSVYYMFFFYIYTCISKHSWLAKNRQKMYLCLCLDIKAPLPLLLPNA